MDIKELEKKFQASLEHFKQELAKLRTGRANVGLLEEIKVDYYGTPTPLKSLGLISAPEPRLLTVQVYDASAVEQVEKAIREAELGLNPSRDGNLVRVAIPSLTEERRKEVVKKLHKIAEEARIAIRNQRRDATQEVKKQEKEGEISEDEMRRQQDQIQKLTDKYISQIDSLMEEKEKEILSV
ncbi:MAG: ribosome recycling factor [Candidatus Dadabacteria bacterium]|nr:MAG: ribosome recycling factor [Candidatus Dadabacteria bacterium]